MKPKPIAATLLLIAAVLGHQQEARAETLVAALSDPLIEITGGFSGASMLLFGAADEGDIVVVVSGPPEELVVRRKRRIGGIWVNRESVTLSGVPAYYAVSATNSLASIASPKLLAELGIGAANLEFEAREDLTPAELEEFTNGVLRNKERDELYPASKGSVGIVGGTLFRTKISFPANAPAGTYSVDVYLFRDGALVQSQTTPLFVAKSGIERAVFELANQQPALYGIIAILIAIAGGWFAAAAFRRT